MKSEGCRSDSPSESATVESAGCMRGRVTNPVCGVAGPEAEPPLSPTASEVTFFDEPLLCVHSSSHILEHEGPRSRRVA